MKYILAALLILLWTDMLFAGENCTETNLTDEVKETVLITTDVPNHLKGASIIVRRADGVETAVPAELFKVVPRKQQRVITKVQESSIVTCKETLDNKNRISLLGGHGPKAGLDKHVDSKKATMKTRTGLVGAGQYQRSFNEKWSGAVQLQTNESVFLGIGRDF